MGRGNIHEQLSMHVDIAVAGYGIRSSQTGLPQMRETVLFSIVIASHLVPLHITGPN